jgi:hypothetical protein
MKAKVETWLEQLRTGAIKSNIVRVLAHIKSKDFGTDILAMRKSLGMSHQSLTAVISMLADEGLLMEAGIFQHESSWYTTYVFVEHPETRKELARKRKREKYVQWLNRGIEEYADIMPSSLRFELIIEQREAQQARDN